MINMGDTLKPILEKLNKLDENMATKEDVA